MANHDRKVARGMQSKASHTGHDDRGAPGDDAERGRATESKATVAEADGVETEGVHLIAKQHPVSDRGQKENGNSQDAGHGSGWGRQVR